MNSIAKKSKGLVAVVFAAILAFAMMAFTGISYADGTASAKITGVEEGATVTLTKVAHFDTTTNTYVWDVTADPSLPDLNSSTTPTITHDQWDDIIAAARNSSTLTKYTSDPAPASGEVTFTGLDRGIYTVTVTNPDNSTFVYLNTGFGVNKSDLGAEDPIEVALKGNNVITTKTVDQSSLAVGETATFTITSTVPNYDEGVTDRTYTIIDTLDEGLVFGQVLSVSGDQSGTLTAGTDYTVSQSGQTITIDFSNDKIATLVTNNDTTITVQLTATRSSSTAELWNHVYTNFSTDSHTSSTSTTPEVDVPVYDFEINLTKTDSSGTAITSDTAEFTLTKVVDGTTYYVQSDGSLSTTEYKFSTSNGVIDFTGLGEGTYTLTETKAPDGYYISDAEHTIVVKGVYTETEVTKYYTDTNASGTTTTTPITYTINKLTGYTLTVDGQASNGTVTIGSDGQVTDATASMSITNPAQGELPHTGEAGTIILTICGALLVALAVGMTIRNRKKATE
jgi:LPXTG-motif cell wall-anchored protein